ncbi:general secretion pathway protein GspB [Shewanella sp. 10N.261.52.F9]|uniref:general secretion pathway protein GspB n=1 Tax=Shewanella sp. 10N.261.52.F9 TaxID=3229684 RepID=UPI00354CF92C
MSILLDAVTRDKQQSQAITHDVVLTPRAQYKAKQQDHGGVKFAALFVLSLLLMVVAAWLVSKALSPITETVSSIHEHTAPDSISQNPSSENISTENISSQNSTTQQKPVAEVRLAGKVALPVAQTLAPQTALHVSGRSGFNTGANSRANSTQPEAANYISNNYDEALDNPLMAALLNAQESVEQEFPQTATKQQVNTVVEDNNRYSNDYEPIILGANSNKRGNDLLDSLKYEVEYAANEVGLETNEPDPNNNLLAAFEAALKDVEREKSVETPVTEAKLDPIPTTPKSDAIPKYGQLPAGLQLQVPEFNINAHVYSSVADNRWLNVDGAELQEGDSIQGKLTIVEIRPRDVVLAIQGTEFKVPAI